MMELNPKDTAIQRRLSMHHVAQKHPATSDYYSLQEIALGHLIVRIPASNTEAMKAIKSVTGLDLPTKALTSAENNHFVINWISPDEFLILTADKTEHGLEAKLREKMQGHFAIVDVSGGQTVLSLSGERAESILKKSTTCDVHLSVFPIGKVVTTVFAKSQVVLRRTGEDNFQLIVRRSFSDYIWQWIIDAGSRA